jgi:hypothetical protein
MAAELPEIARLANRGREIRHRREPILGTGRRVRRRLARIVEDQVDLRLAEARQINLEIEVDQRLQFLRQDLTVPAAILGELVVGEEVSAPFRRSEVGEAKGRDLFHAEELGGLDPAVPGNDLAVVTDEDRIIESEPLDALGDLLDLLLRVRPRVAAIGPQRADVNVFKGSRGHGVLHADLHGHSIYLTPHRSGK